MYFLRKKETKKNKSTNLKDITSSGVWRQKVFSQLDEDGLTGILMSEKVRRPREGAKTATKKSAKNST